MTVNTKFMSMPREDRNNISEIADRACTIYFQATKKRLSKLEFIMDIAACHSHGNPLRLEDLAQADDFNLAHDVFGITRYLDRDTGKLTDCFRPRFSQQAQRSGDRESQSASKASA